MALFPFRETRQRFLLILPATDLDQRILLRPRSSLGRLHAWRLARLLAIVGRPWRVALPLTLLPRRQLQEPVEGARFRVDVGMTVADLRETFRHRAESEVFWIGAIDFVPAQWRRNARVRRRPDRVRRRHGTVLGVLVVVHEHTLPLFFPPLAGRELRCAPFHFPSQGQRRPAHLVKAPPPLDAHEEMHAARACSAAPPPLATRRPQRPGNSRRGRAWCTSASERESSRDSRS